MTQGVFRRYFWFGIIAGCIVPVILIALFSNPFGLIVGSIAALAGLLAFEHAYVQAGTKCASRMIKIDFECRDARPCIPTASKGRVS